MKRHPLFFISSRAIRLFFIPETTTYLRPCFLFFLILCWFSASQPVLGQCPPPGFPEPADNCQAPPLFCDLDGYCNETSTVNVMQAFPGCPSNVLNNTHWFAFQAATPNVWLRITPSNCQQVPGNPSINIGMQGAIYAGECFDSPIAKQCACVNQPFLLGSDNFTPCDTYYLVLDGCAGDLCDYSIEIMAGSVGCGGGGTLEITSDSPLACPPDSAEACQRVCANTSITYEVQDLPPNSQVTWQVNGAAAFSTDGNQVTVEWGAPGTGEVVAEVAGNDGKEPLQIFCGQTGIDLQTGFAEGRVRFLGGTPPYVVSMSLNGSAVWTNASPNATWWQLNSLQEGLYFLQVSDAAGKTASCHFTATTDPQDCWVTVIPMTVGHPPACDVCTGAIYTQIFSSSGLQNLSFQWSTGNSTQHHTNLCAGTYQVTVTNSAGCTGTASVQLSCPEPTCLASFSLCVEILQSPKAAFSTTPAAAGNLLQICQGQEVFFENTSQDAASFAWVFGDGDISAQASPSHTYLVPGTYTAALIARNDCFCADTAFLVIEVLPANLPEIDCVGNICEGDVVTYSSGDDCGSFDWAVSGNAQVLGGGGAGDDFITVEWLTGQAEGWISLQTSDCGSVADCPAANVVPIAILSEQVQIQGPDKVCPGATAEYFIPDYQGTTIGWQVSAAGTIISPGAGGGSPLGAGGVGTNRIVVEWTGGLPNPQHVIVFFDNCFLGCSGQDTLLVNIRQEFYVAGDIQFCQDATGQFSARNTATEALVTCHWQVLNAAGSVVWAAPLPSHSPSIFFDFPGGNYTVRAVPASLSSFCNDHFDVPVHVFANPAAVGSIVGDLLICPGETYNYSAPGSPSGAGGGGFEWTIQNGSATSTATGNPINVTWGSASPRILTVSQISPNGLLCTSEPFSVSVSEFPPVSIAGDPLVCFEETANYTASPVQTTDYQWKIEPPEAGAIIAGQGTTSVFVFWRQPGNASVELTTCNSAASFPVEVWALPEPVVTDDAVCQGMATQVQTTQPFSSYIWRNSSLTVVSTSATSTLVPGAYTVQVTDQNGCTGKDIFNIAQHPVPVFHLSVPIHLGICPGGPGTTIHATTDAVGLDYQWLFNGVPTGGNSPALPVNEAGLYRVIVTDPNGCTADEQLSLADCEDIGGTCVNGICTANIPPCNADGNVSFEIQPTGECNVRHYVNTSVNVVPGSLQWTFGNGTTSTQPNPTITYAVPGFYSAVLNGLLVNLSPPPPFCADQFWLQDTVLALADFSAASGCPGSPVQFTDRTEHMDFATLTAWQWDFGDPASGAANVSSDQNPAHVYASHGTYTVSLTVTISPSGVGGGSCQTSRTRTVTVNPLPTVSFVQPAAGCDGSAFQFSLSASNDVAALAWNFGDPASGVANFSEKTEPLHVFDAPGTYPVSVTVTNALGCTADFSAPVQVVANTLTGSIAYSQPPPICAGDSIILTASPSGVGGGGSMSFLWSNGSTASNVTIKESSISKVTVTDAFGCNFTPPPAVVDVFGAPNALVQAVEFNEFGQPIAIFTDSYEACEGEPVHLQIIGELGYTYSWSNGSNDEVLTFTEDKDNLLPNGAHVFNVTVTNSATGCTSIEGIWVMIRPNPVVAIASSPAGFICEGTPATLAVTSPQPGTSYTWNTGETGTSISAITSGKYFAVAANGFGCTAKSNEIEIQAAPGAGKFPLGCLTRCLPTEICLPDLPNVVGWQWYLNGAPVPPAAGGNLPSPSFTQSGDYQVEMTDVYGCVNLSGVLSLDLLPGYGTIGGQVFFDVNDNGVIDPADTTVSGIPIVLTTPGGAPLDTMNSNPTGNYIFNDILSTTYSLQVDTASLPPFWAVALGNGDLELVGCDDEAAQNFLLTKSCLPTSSNLTLEICSEDSVSYAGEILHAGETEIFTLTSEGGCDSTVMVTVAFLPSLDGIGDVDICLDESFVLYPGIEFPAGTDTVLTSINQHGCLDTLFLSVGILPYYFVNETLTTCPGTTVEYDGQQLSPGDTVDFVFENSFGCDSIVSVSVVALLATDTTFVHFESCGQQAVIFQGQEIQPGEQATFTFSSWQGCDSTVTVSVAALPISDTTFVQFAACPGQAVTFNGQILLPGQQFNWLDINEFGCDSVVSATVSLLPHVVTMIDEAACEGEFVEILGQQILAGTQTILTQVNAAGCLDTFLVSVAELPTANSQLQLTACPGSTVSYLGVPLSPGDSAVVVFANQWGCDSTVTVTVQAASQDTVFEQLLVCTGSSTTTYNGQIFQVGDEATFVLTSTVGCDSLVKISVLQAPPIDFWATTEPICSGSEQGLIHFWSHVSQTEPFEFSIDGGLTFDDTYEFAGLPAGHYQLAARDRIGCIFEDEITIASLPPLLVQVPDSVGTCVDSIPLLFSVAAPSLPYSWQWQSPAQAGGGISTDSIFWATLPGEYLLTVANECDTVKKTVAVRLEEDLPLTKVYVPNSFSPNEDGFNDCFRSYVSPEVQLLEYQLEIFDRWGNHVFGTREVEGCWDGKFRERWMDPAVLVWFVKMKVVNCRGDAVDVFKEGGVTIVR